MASFFPDMVYIDVFGPLLPTLYKSTAAFKRFLFLQNVTTAARGFLAPGDHFGAFPSPEFCLKFSELKNDMVLRK